MRLLSKASTAPVRRQAGRDRPDAIVVPASRPASALAAVAALAKEVGTRLVVLCSLQATVEQVAERLEAEGARGLVVEIGTGYRCPTLRSRRRPRSSARRAADGPAISAPSETSGCCWRRLCGWRKIIFLDDDITVTRSDIARLSTQLDTNQIAGMICRDFPDNSVVCHARRLAGLPQDNFVTGAVMGVNCGDLPLPFFPDIYNEDWFSFGEAAARHALVPAGEARQAEYQPFGNADRAGHEEFGDLLAEGLYTLFEINGPLTLPGQLKTADEAYWTKFIQERRNVHTETADILSGISAGANTATTCRRRSPRWRPLPSGSQ